MYYIKSVYTESKAEYFELLTINEYHFDIEKLNSTKFRMNKTENKDTLIDNKEKNLTSNRINNDINYSEELQKSLINLNGIISKFINNMKNNRTEDKIYLLLNKNNNDNEDMKGEYKNNNIVKIINKDKNENNFNNNFKNNNK